MEKMTIANFVGALEQLFLTGTPQRQAMDKYTHGARAAHQEWLTTEVTMLWILKYCHDCLVILMKQQGYALQESGSVVKQPDSLYAEWIHKVLRLAYETCEWKVDVKYFPSYMETQREGAHSFLFGTLLSNALAEHCFPGVARIADIYTTEGFEQTFVKWYLAFGQKPEEN